MQARGLLGPLGLLALVGASVAGVAAQVPSGAADVGVTVDATGGARVEERYVLTPVPPTVELRVLMRPCAEIGGLSVERDGARVAVVGEREEPWLVFRDTTAVRGDTLRMTVRYDVGLSVRHADVPLLHLTAPIPQRDGEREGAVRVLVRFADPSGRVRFPHLAREAPAEWGARFVAIPSFVEVHVADPEAGMTSECAARATAAGDDGGLAWRFLVFVGIMAAWVPLYLLWAGRSREVGE